MKKNQFNTKFGVVAATVGSAVGLGNIWRFPYEAGAHGGGAFLIVYLLFVLILGIPVICAEFLIGHSSGADVYTAFTKLNGGRLWRLVGRMGLAAALLILGFYSVVAGWTVEYIYQSVISFGGATTADELHAQFGAFSSDAVKPLWWILAFLAANYVILIRGVGKGIERMSNILMPLLFVILLVFVINSLMLPKAAEGLEFLFKPDFSAITPSVVLGALGQAFFSLSLGLGCLITYASYFRADTPLVKTATISALLDMLVAIMAGVIIFPAVFTYGQEPSAGPQLVFEVLPSIFLNMPGGIVWATLFFILLFVASLTSTLSMFEILIAYMERSLSMSRLKAVSLTLMVVIVLSTLCSLSFGKLDGIRVFGLNLFSLSDYLSSNILLPVGGILISIFAGWIVERHTVRLELLGSAPSTLLRISVRIIIFNLRYLAPIGIGLIFIFGL
ncbi:MAG: sodium-dependent transporter [Duncaniella sp.]|nr:sodium-dependent transporter [Duncaniella sp.]